MSPASKTSYDGRRRFWFSKQGPGSCLTPATFRKVISLAIDGAPGPTISRAVGIDVSTMTLWRIRGRKDRAGREVEVESIVDNLIALFSHKRAAEELEDKFFAAFGEHIDLVYAVFSRMFDASRATYEIATLAKIDAGKPGWQAMVWRLSSIDHSTYGEDPKMRRAKLKLLKLEADLMQAKIAAVASGGVSPVSDDALDDITRRLSRLAPEG